MKPGSNQTVFVTPVFEENPYQARLSAAMREQGYNVIEHPGDMHWFQAVLAAQPSIVHIHWPHPLCFGNKKLRSILKSQMFIRRLAALKKQGVKVVWTCHNLGNHQGKWLALERRTLRHASRYFDRILVHHEEAIDRVTSYFRIKGGSSRFRVVRLANYIGEYPGQTPQAQARDQLGYGLDETVLLLFGGLRPQKGIERLVDGFKSLRPEGHKLRLVLAGPPPADYRPALRALVENDERIDLQDRFVSDEDVERYHRAADIAMLPYSSGLTSSALILAMGFGLPIVCGDFGGAKTDVDGDGGIMLPDNEPETLRQGIQTMLTSRSKWPTMGEHNYRMVKDQSWESMARQTIACYQEIN